MRKSIKKWVIVFCLPLVQQGQAQTDNSGGATNLGYLNNLNGHWEASTTITMGEKKEKTKYYVDFSMTADGHGLLMNEQCDLPGMGTLRGTNLIGFDPTDGKIHWYTVDNFGTTHEHVGNFEDARHFRMIHRSVQDGKNYIEEITMFLKNENKLDLKVIATLDDQIQEIIEGTFNRTSESARLDPRGN